MAYFNLTKHSRGHRQCSGTAGRVENCQIGVFLSYASPAGRTFLDRELCLPNAWMDDTARCKCTGIPAKVEMATTPVLAADMIVLAADMIVLAADMIELARVAVTRCAIEETFQTFKGETGSATTWWANTPVGTGTSPSPFSPTPSLPSSAQKGAGAPGFE